MSMCLVTQLCLTHCDPRTAACQAPLSMGILQARILEWVAMPFSRVSSQPRDWIQVSCFAGGFFTSWATREAQEYWSGKPRPSPADLPDPGIKLGSTALQVDSLPTELSGKPQKKWSGPHSQQKSLNCNLKNDRMISVCFEGKPSNITVIQVDSPTTNAEETEVEWFYEDLQDFLEHQKKMSFSS